MIETRGAGRRFARWVSFPLPLARHSSEGRGLCNGHLGHRPRSAKPTASGAAASHDQTAVESGVAAAASRWRRAAIERAIARGRLGAPGGDARDATRASGGRARRVAGRRLSPSSPRRRAHRRAAQAHSARATRARPQPRRSKARTLMASSHARRRATGEPEPSTVLLQRRDRRPRRSPLGSPRP
jgi:hypothetical protein